MTLVDRAPLARVVGGFEQAGPHAEFGQRLHLADLLVPDHSKQCIQRLPASDVIPWCAVCRERMDIHL